MTTAVTYTLYFSRKAGEHPFLSISTCIFNNSNHLVHSHSTIVPGDYDFQRRELLASWRDFQAEKADNTEIVYNHGTYGKSITITKYWG